VCFVWIWEQTAIISLFSVNWLVCNTVTECVYCAVRTGSINATQAQRNMYILSLSLFLSFLQGGSTKVQTQLSTSAIYGGHTTVSLSHNTFCYPLHIYPTNTPNLHLSLHGKRRFIGNPRAPDRKKKSFNSCSIQGSAAALRHHSVVTADSSRSADKPLARLTVKRRWCQRLLENTPLHFGHLIALKWRRM
jgi:hypothetical protein